MREKPEEDDMRAVVVRMSTSGHEAVEQGIPDSNEGAIIPGLSAQDRQDLVDLLSEVNAALESLGLSDQDRRSQESHGYGSPSTGHYDRGGHSYGRDDHSRGGYGRDDRGGRGGYGRDSRGHDDRGGHGGYRGGSSTRSARYDRDGHGDYKRSSDRGGSRDSGRSY